jgi:hypothetical protein
MENVTSVTTNFTRQLMSPTGLLIILLIALLAVILTGFVNSKVDGVSNEKITVGTGAVGAGTSTANEITWEQPKNTVITSIKIVCTTAAAVAEGDIGYKVGTTSGGVNVVAAVTDGILDGGTAVPAGATYNLTLVGTTASDAAPATSTAYTTVKRTLYFGTTHTTTATAVGAFKWLVEYQAV